MAVPTPPTPPMTPTVRRRLYGIWAWVSVILALGAVGTGASSAYWDVPDGVTGGLAVAGTVALAAGGFLGFMAGNNVDTAPAPAAALDNHAPEGDV